MPENRYGAYGWSFIPKNSRSDGAYPTRQRLVGLISMDLGPGGMAQDQRITDKRRLYRTN